MKKLILKRIGRNFELLDILAESFFYVNYVNVNYYLQLLIVNIYFFYKMFSLDWNQNSIKNADIADCLKKIWKLIKTKQINCQIIWHETIRKLIDGLEVSKSWNQNTKFSHTPKKQRNFVHFFALASKKWWKK